MLVRSLSLAGLLAVNCLAQPYFFRKDILVGQNPTTVIPGDFNGDGLPDLAVATDEGIFVLLNTGGGNFSSPIRTITPGRMFWMPVAADFNGDGKADLVGSGQIFLSRGDGTFLPPTSIGGQEAAAAADFNGDGKMDLLLSNYDWNTGEYKSDGVRILLGNGDGTFRLGTKISAYGPIALQVADFNRDGRPDVAMLGLPDTYPGLTGRGLTALLVYLGRGDGTFGPAIQTQIPTASNTWPYTGFLVADFNGDNLPDVFSMSGVMPGKGDGTFGAPIPYLPDAHGFPITAGDFTGDGKVDMVMTYEGNALAICPGKGDGTLLPPVAQPIAFGFAYTYAAIAVDLDADGRLDLVTANGLSNSISVLTNKAEGGPSLRRAVSSAIDLAIVAPGSIATLYAPTPAVATEANPPWPYTLDGTILQVQDSSGSTRQAPLLYVSPTQVNFQVPDETAPGEAKLRIGTQSGPTDAGGMEVAAAAPTIAMLPGSFGIPNASAVLVNPDGTQVPLSIVACPSQSECELEPIMLSTAGDGTIYVSVFGTGFGNPEAEDVGCSINGLLVPTTYGQPVPGLDQVNIRLVPEVLNAVGYDPNVSPIWGTAPATVTIRVAGIPANSFQLSIE